MDAATPSAVGIGSSANSGSFTGFAPRAPQSWGSPMPPLSRSNDSQMMDSYDGQQRSFGGPRTTATNSPQRDFTAKPDPHGPSAFGRGGSSIQCRVCQRSFPSYPELKQHIRDENHYDTSRLPATKDSNYAEVGSRSSANAAVENRFPQSFACRVCKTTFPTFQEMKQHIRAENHYASTKETPTTENILATNDISEGTMEDQYQGIPGLSLFFIDMTSSVIRFQGSISG